MARCSRTDSALLLGERELDAPLGRRRRKLIEQRYPARVDLALIDGQLMPYFLDSRYLRVRGAPVFLVYRPGAMPNHTLTRSRWLRGAGFD